MNKIKIGQTDYPIQKGDYIMMKDDVYRFYSGNRRILAVKNNHHFCFVHIPKSSLKGIPFEQMKRVNKRTAITVWYFE